MTERKRDLLEKFASAFLDGRDPFSTDSLCENEVTFDECMSASEAIGLVLLGYLNAPRGEQSEIMSRGAAIHAGIPSEILEHALARMRVQRGLERLKKI